MTDDIPGGRVGGSRYKYLPDVPMPAEINLGGHRDTHIDKYASVNSSWLLIIFMAQPLIGDALPVSSFGDENLYLQENFPVQCPIV